MGMTTYDEQQISGNRFKTRTIRVLRTSETREPKYLSDRKLYQLISYGCYNS
jgi:hypothetical protein